MITFEEVKEMFKKSIDATDTMNQALENLIQSIYLKGYNDALNKIRKEVVCLTYYWCEVNPKSVKEDVLEIIDKCKQEG